MFQTLMYMAPVAVFMALLTLSIQRQHLLMGLLALEAMILTLTLMLTAFIMLDSPSELILALVVLTFGACEASLGLACLVSLSRALGNDLCKNMTMTK
uniref:NADH-ubiquinone oxidoreductase chain 4L n=1 Tax=Nephtys sp. 'San Juan Island' YV-2008 TaxID=505245 RepID=B2C6Q6_9ANNE|nr:NADH dehydrogenase subunit 4L [Nephtys sp. 'San Juan Island' YV-2008]